MRWNVNADMKTALLGLGVLAVAIPVYDEAALYVNNSSASLQLPFIWQGSLANALPEIWLAIAGAILILLAIFL